MHNFNGKSVRAADLKAIASTKFCFELFKFVTCFIYIPLTFFLYAHFDVLFAEGGTQNYIIMSFKFK